MKIAAFARRRHSKGSRRVALFARPAMEFRRAWGLCERIAIGYGVSLILPFAA